jgi:hypothetical protein
MGECIPHMFLASPGEGDSERERENGELGSIPSPLLARERDGRGQGPRVREIQ